MSTERPFGDPTNIRQENAAAVGKGVLFGCGGCALLVAAAFVMLLLFAAGVLYMMSLSGPGQEVYAAAQKSEVLRRELGEPIAKGWFMSGHVSVNNDSGTARLTIPLSGPKGSASLQIEAEMRQGLWHYQEARAIVEGRSDSVDLRPLLRPGNESLP